MERLSLKESKKRCAELWDWIADNPEKGKSKWPLWEYNGGKYSYAMNQCFACEYTRTRKHDSPKCEKCFLLNLWFSDKIPENVTKMIIKDGCTPCEDAPNSPYKLFRTERCIGTNREASFYAKKIADYCKEH